MSDLSPETVVQRKLSMPGPRACRLAVYARRGEVQAAAAADERHSVYALHSVRMFGEKSPDHRVRLFQLYVLRDRGFMRNALERAKAAGCSTLVLPSICQPGARNVMPIPV